MSDPLILIPGVNDTKKSADVWVPKTQIDDLRHEIDHQYDNAKFEAKPHGLVFVDGKEVASTLQCPHCGEHFVSRKGSGIRRAWCPACRAVTCGAHQCDPCQPFVKELGMSQGRMV
jgi:hypothetical protein